MSYDLSFFPRDGHSFPPAAALTAWFEARPNWCAEEFGATYENGDTGSRFQLVIDRSDASISLSMPGTAAHVTGFELRDEVAAFVAAFEFEVDDPQMEGMGRGPIDRDKLLAGWNFYNSFATKVRHLLQGSPIPPHAPAAQIEAAFAWNRGRAALERGDELFVPKISFASDLGRAQTFVTWCGNSIGKIPVVSRIVTPLKTVSWEAIERALEGASRSTTPAPHYDVNAAVAKRIEAALEAVESLGLPTMIAASQVRTTEVLAPYLGGAISASVDNLDSLLEIAHAAHTNRDYHRAHTFAKRALEHDGTNAWAAGIAAVSTYQIAEFADALRYVDLLLSLDPSNRHGMFIRCGVLTNLARFDQAVEVAERALENGPDAMVENMKAYALSAAGKIADSLAAYECALTLVTAELESTPTNGDLLSRKAYSLIGLGRAEEALATATEALELVSDPRLTLQTIARAELLLGRPELAAQALERLGDARLATAPMAAYYLALAYARMELQDSAAFVLRYARKSPDFAARIAAEPLLRDL